MRSVRTASAAALLGCVLCLVSCFGHHTSDEEVLKRPAGGDDDPSTAGDTVHEESDEDDSSSGAAGGDLRKDAGMCAGVTDAIEAFVCQAGLGGSGGIDDLISGVLGGGMGNMNCARETDLVAMIVCQAASGSGIDGIIDDLLGGGSDGGAARSDAGLGRNDAGLGRGDAGLGRSDAGVGLPSSDGGIDRAAFVQAIQRIIEQLLTAFFSGAVPLRDAGLSQLRISSGEKSARADDLVRSHEQCREALQDDLLTRLVCARQALAELSAEP